MCSIILLTFVIASTFTRISFAEQQDVYLASNTFGVDLFLALANQSEANEFISPVSLSLAFGQVYVGAKENTAKQMREVLGYDKAELDDENVHKGHKQMMQSLVNNDNYQNYIVALFNRLLIDEKIVIHDSFKNKVEEYYSVQPESINFKEGSEVVDRLNEMIKKDTQNRIQAIFDKIPSDVRLILVNCIYFFGNWKTPFNVKDTSKREFYTFGTTPKKVKMMQLTQKIFKYYKDKDTDSQTIELPYKGGDKNSGVNMYIILPNEKEGLPTMKNELSLEKINNIIKSMKRQMVNLYLPKFRIEKKYDMEGIFPGLGMSDLFRDKAELSGITKKQVHVQKVLHKTVVEVSEYGTEAAAATAVQVATDESNEDAPNIPEFNVDHPFVFLIRDKSTEAILFIGQVNQLN